MIINRHDHLQGVAHQRGDALQTDRRDLIAEGSAIVMPEHVCCEFIYNRVLTGSSGGKVYFLIMDDHIFV